MAVDYRLKVEEPARNFGTIGEKQTGYKTKLA
jgi:hypothetical protein